MYTALLFYIEHLLPSISLAATYEDELHHYLSLFISTTLPRVSSLPDVILALALRGPELSMYGGYVYMPACIAYLLATCSSQALVLGNAWGAQMVTLCGKWKIGWGFFF